MFDKQYYEDKKVKLGQKLGQKKNKVIQDMASLLQDYLNDEQDIIKELQEITKNESKIREANPVEVGSEEVSKDGEGKVRPNKSDSPKKTK